MNPLQYEIWCSTDHGNKRLDSAFKERQGKGSIYLFFSVNGSGHFCGIAQMLTDVNYNTAGESVWVQDKFKGQFKVSLFVKCCKCCTEGSVTLATGLC